LELANEFRPRRTGTPLQDSRLARSPDGSTSSSVEKFESKVDQEDPQEEATLLGRACREPEQEVVLSLRSSHRSDQGEEILFRGRSSEIHSQVTDDGVREVQTFLEDESLEGDEDPQFLPLPRCEESFRVGEDSRSELVESVVEKYAQRMEGIESEVMIRKGRERIGMGRKGKEQTGRCCRWRTEFRRASSVKASRRDSDDIRLDSEARKVVPSLPSIRTRRGLEI